MLSSTDDTIVAIASAPGGAVRGVLRMSGPESLECLAACFTMDQDQCTVDDECTAADDGKFTADEGGAAVGLPTGAARVVRGHLALPDPLPPLPCEAYVWPTQRSYTRQPSVEIHTIGSPPLLEAALEALCAAGARLAGPGEFTLRAFLAGRLDLTQAEAILGVIDARDRDELNVALEQLSGGLAGPLRQLRNQLLDLLAHLEAGLDFVDEDIEFISPEELQRQLAAAEQTINQLRRQLTAREETSVEARVVLRGWPNVGKSSLMNALAGEQAALVSDTAGTTRDFLGCRIDLDGVVCELIDTAGMEPMPGDPLAEHAQAMSDLQRRQARLELFCLDASRPRNEWERLETAVPADRPRLLVWTKADRLTAAERSAIAGRMSVEGIWTSSHSGEGLSDLRGAIRRHLAQSAVEHHGFVPATAVRCRESLRSAAEGLARARDLASGGWGEELVAAEVRVSLDELGTVVGAVYTDDVLDRIFSRFCIGK